ncbi:4-hydroxy-tetrahydrodipicolinate reductase [Candidatus Riesia pediculischaeffi]|nr:4-hydroxy-tetrahydrodipicolinate reductase [Candidatus Riesia pediculischaeffi]
MNVSEYDRNRIRIVIAGSSGRMGGSLIKFFSKDRRFLIKFLLEESLKKGIKIRSYFSYQNISDQFDIFVDFTSPLGTMKHVSLCKKLGKPIIIGTTGFDKRQIRYIAQFSQSIPILISENFSFGMNFLFRSFQKFSNFLIENYTIKIMEIHHKDKIDVPSGTSIKIKNIFSELIVREDNLDFNDEGHDCCKIDSQNKNINISSVRSFCSVSEHRISFSNRYEKLDIKHTVQNRDVFCEGVMRSCLWIVNKDKGLYSSQEVFFERDG